MKFVLKNAHISGVSISNGPGECASSQVTKTLKKNKKTLNGDICCLDVDRRSKQTFIHMYVQLLGSIRASKNNEKQTHLEYQFVPRIDTDIHISRQF